LTYRWPILIAEVLDYEKLPLAHADCFGGVLGVKTDDPRDRGKVVGWFHGFARLCKATAGPDVTMTTTSMSSARFATKSKLIHFQATPLDFLIKYLVQVFLLNPFRYLKALPSFLGYVPIDRLFDA
jgi:hypothetical protein